MSLSSCVRLRLLKNKQTNKHSAPRRKKKNPEKRIRQFLLKVYVSHGVIMCCTHWIVSTIPFQPCAQSTASAIPFPSCSLHFLVLVFALSIPPQCSSHPNTPPPRPPATTTTTTTTTTTPWRRVSMRSSTMMATSTRVSFSACSGDGEICGPYATRMASSNQTLVFFLPNIHTGHWNGDGKRDGLGVVRATLCVCVCVCVCVCSLSSICLVACLAWLFACSHGAVFTVQCMALYGCLLGSIA